MVLKLNCMDFYENQSMYKSYFNSAPNLQQLKKSLFNSKQPFLKQILK